MQRVVRILDNERPSPPCERALSCMSQIFATISEGFVALDHDGKVLWANDRTGAFLGLRLVELIGKRLGDVLSDERAGELARACAGVASGQESAVVEDHDRAAGRWLSWSIYPSDVGFSVLLQDITARKDEQSAMKRSLDYLREEVDSAHDPRALIGVHGDLAPVFAAVTQVARTDATVLILGDTGTGKEMIARALHRLSSRRDQPLVKLNCAAISPTLIESELFGHEKGAFTGAEKRRVGRFEAAHGGTIFLDEVGELSAEAQAKLLRVLQEGELERVGGSETIEVNVRVIAATNRDLEGWVRSGKFREDLYYRLNVFPITLPRLADRPADLAPLVRHFIAKQQRKLACTFEEPSRAVLDRLAGYSWPGNVRELEHEVERSAIIAAGSGRSINEVLGSRLPEADPELACRTGSGSLEDIERGHVLETLESTGWVIEGPNGAAVRLGLNPNTLRSRLKRYGLSRPSRPFAVG